jgi:hypothetical protein
MDIKFPFNQDVEQAQEKILQAKSAQEIKELLKQDDPQKPNFQEALTRLVSKQIMKQFTPEEIAHVESLSPNRLTRFITEEDRERHYEFQKLASKMDDSVSITAVMIAAQKHDPARIPPDQREFIEPHKTVAQSIPSAVLEHLKNPHAVENIFNDILPKIRQGIEYAEQHDKIKPSLAKTFLSVETDRYSETLKTSAPPPVPERELEIARKTGYVQGVCECVAAIGDDHTLGKKLLSEMNVNRDMAKKYSNPETFKVLEQGIFAQKQEQQLEQTHGLKR